VHQPVHDEGPPGHVSRVLEDGDEGEEDEDVGKEDYHGPRSTYDAVLNE